MNLGNFNNEENVVLNKGLTLFSTKFPMKDETHAWEKEANTGPTAPRTPHQLSHFEWHKSQLAQARAALTRKSGNFVEPPTGSR